MEVPDIKKVFLRAVRRQTAERVVSIRADLWAKVGGKLSDAVKAKADAIKKDAIAYAADIGLFDDPETGEVDEDLKAKADPGALEEYLGRQLLVSVSVSRIREACDDGTEAAAAAPTPPAGA